MPTLDSSLPLLHCYIMTDGKPKDLTECKRFFLKPGHPKQRQYEAIRAFFVEGLPSYKAARAFGYSPGAFRVLCHQFRRQEDPQFFITPKRGPQVKTQKALAHMLILQMRKKNFSIYEISETLKEQKIALSPSAVREVLKEEGFAPLPRRLDEERPSYPRPTIEPVADVRSFLLAPGKFQTRCGGLFLFLPFLVRFDIQSMARAAKLPGSRMIPASQALLACLSLKLWSIERKSHIMAFVCDQGLALFSGLNVVPKKSYLSEYSSGISGRNTLKLLGTWQEQVTGEHLFSGDSLNLDFHSVPYYGSHPVIQRHYVSSRSHRVPSILVFLAQDAEGHAFCYSNADIRKGEEPEEIFRFLAFWKKTHGKMPGELVFDSRLTTYANLARLDAMGIQFITLRRRTRGLIRQIDALPQSAWRKVELDVPTRQYRFPSVFEQKIRLAGCSFRQLFVTDLGHEEPTILLTNEKKSLRVLITRYAQRMLIENALSDAVRFFHMDALSSAVGLKVDFDMALLVIASSLYRLLARRMRGYSDAQARLVFRDLIDTPADVDVAERLVTVRFHRRAHLPIILASNLLGKPVPIPWWNGLELLLTT
jgi:transposase